MKVKMKFDSVFMLHFFLKHIEIKQEPDGTITYTYNHDYLSNDHLGYLDVSFPDVENSWDVLEIVSFGNFNDCPAADVIVEQSKLWYDKYGAEIVEISHDTIKYSLPDSPDLKKASELKEEIILFAPESISLFNSETDMTEEIIKEKCFYLWWD